MHCFRVVLDSGGEYVPVSPKYELVADAIEHYDHLAPGLHACVTEPFELFVSEYIDVEGLEYVIRDFNEMDMAGLRSRRGDKYYTVVGLYADNQQPWATAVNAESPEEAVGKAVHEMMLTNDWGTADGIRVAEVLEDDCRCTGVTQVVMPGQEALDPVAPAGAGAPC